MEQLAKENLVDKIKFVAVYLRKSRGTGDIDEDLANHSKTIKDYCEKYNWSYVVYEEIASGSDIDHRPQMQKLLKDIEEDMYDAVFAFDVDRMSRGGSADQERIFSKLRNTNTLLVTANPFKIYNMNDENDETLIDVYGFVGKMEYKQIRKRMAAGKKIGLRRGHWTSGVVPFGYEYNRKLKKLEINEEESKIVREMVEMYLDGNSMSDIVWTFNRRKIPSPKGSSWTVGTISRIFKSNVYQGHVVGNKTEGNRSRTKTNTSKPFRHLPESEWITVRNAHKPIISEDEYNQIMAKLKKNPVRRFGNSINTFTGLIKCKRCGETMHHKTISNREGIARCKCGNHGGTVDLIETAIYESSIRLKDELEKIKVDDIQSQKEKQITKQITILEKELDKNDLAIERIEEAFENGLYDVNKTRRKIEERQQERWKLEKELSNLRKQMTAVDTLDNKERISKIDMFLRDIKEETNPEKRNKIYKSVVSEVIWDKPSLTKVGVSVNFL